jgi:hypothetical protein
MFKSKQVVEVAVIAPVAAEVVIELELCLQLLEH